MANDDTYRHLLKSVTSTATEPPEYFMYEDVYCEMVGCEGCDEHFGSVLDVEHRVNSKGDYLGCIVCVGVGGPRIDLDTRAEQIIGYWSGCNPVRKHYPHSEKVAQYWEELFECLK